LSEYNLIQRVRQIVVDNIKFPNHFIIFTRYRCIKKETKKKGDLRTQIEKKVILRKIQKVREIKRSTNVFYPL